MNEEQEYKVGFNASFLLAEHEPALLEKVTRNLIPNSSYLFGFIDGKEQFVNEKSRQELENLAVLRGKSNEKEKEHTI